MLKIFSRVDWPFSLHLLVIISLDHVLTGLMVSFLNYVYILDVSPVSSVWLAKISFHSLAASSLGCFLCCVEASSFMKSYLSVAELSPECCSTIYIVKLWSLPWCPLVEACIRKWDCVRSETFFGHKEELSYVVCNNDDTKRHNPINKLSQSQKSKYHNSPHLCVSWTLQKPNTTSLQTTWDGEVEVPRKQLPSSD